MFSFKKSLDKWPNNISLELEKKHIKVQIKPHARAKNYRLTIQTGGKPVLTVPPNGKLSEANDFLQRHSAWLHARLKHQPKIISFVDGAKIPLRGVEHLLVMDNRLRGQVELIASDNNMVLRVPGGEFHMARRLEDWLKKQARLDITHYVKIHANNLNVTPKAISIRSQSSRWGSCASSGRLSFNWRLIMAPPFVLDYVAAHEVAHLLEMNHSLAFWKNVERTLPEMSKGRAWLKANGQKLMVYNLK